MDEPVQLDSNTTVTLAEYIPDSFVRDSQVFKKSDESRTCVPSGCEEYTRRARIKVWLFPAYNAPRRRRTATYKFDFREMNMG